MRHLFKAVVLIVFLTVIVLPFAVANAQERDVASKQRVKKIVTLFIFERDDCAHCVAEKTFLASLDVNALHISIVHKNIADKEVRKVFERIVKKYHLPVATPVTLVGSSVISGFDSPESTGKEIKQAINQAQKEKIFNATLGYYLGTSALGDISVSAQSSVCESDSEKCTLPGASAPSVTLRENFSFFGWEINIKNMGLFSIASILGVIDGFNPCAMWVLLTFLIALSQIGSRKKMAQVVGLFIVAEAVMYFLILNVWYQVWDFVKLDAIVTPLVGLFSIGAGLYFLYKWYTAKDTLTCEVSSVEHQQSVVQKIQDIAKKPMTLAVMFAVVALALSVNIIEFACSVGIAQTFTKVLEINNLNFFMRQFYIGVYTVGYMLDDIIVFALALWGYKKFYAIGSKYSKHSTFFAAVLMILLGVMLVFFRDLLVL